MVEPETTSESEEMFLTTVARALEDGHSGPVPMPMVATELSISRVSANEMAKKLVNRGFIDYEPYRGVTLTPAGAVIANIVLRRRRLWSLFFAERLGIPPVAADAIACEFEHITPAEVAARLSDLLGDPTLDPVGRPIPAAQGVVRSGTPDRTLAEVEAGGEYRVTGVVGDTAVRSFLADEGIVNGVVIAVPAIGADGGCLVVGPSGRVHLSRDVAACVAVAVD